MGNKDKTLIPELILYVSRAIEYPKIDQKYFHVFQKLFFWSDGIDQNIDGGTKLVKFCNKFVKFIIKNGLLQIRYINWHILEIVLKGCLNNI